LISARQIEELAAFASNAERAAEAEDLDRFFEAHLAFRRKIWESSGNKYLLQAIERVVTPLYALYLIRRSQNREGILQTVADCLEHQKQIISSYKSRDFARAESIARDFLLRMKEHMKKALPAAGA
jgi:DNA-binding GntR family transcriptional regulator